MSQDGATSIQDLQVQNRQPVVNGDGSRAVVQEILQEIESNNHKNIQDNNSQQQYYLDQNVQQTSFAPQNQDDSRRMQQEMMMQQMQMEQEQNDLTASSRVNKAPKTLSEKIISQLKSPLIVAAIFLLLNVVPTKQLLQKIPKALSDTGSVTFVGSVVISLIAGLLFYVINMLTKNI